VKLDLLSSLYVFMLAAFIGFEVIRRVSPLLHTPLMSLTNALDAIAVVGAIILAGEHKTTLATILGTIAIVSATSNIVGGFIITDRMLKMFKSSGAKKHEPGCDLRDHRDCLHHCRGSVHPVAEMSSPTTARRGVFAGEAGMLLAIVGTLLHHDIVDYKWIAIALVLGTVIGIPLGRVHMTAVPQRTALSHALAHYA
jgi:proton-translocating NAD(P)+ transhydrogenase subunit alpha